MFQLITEAEFADANTSATEDLARPGLDASSNDSDLLNYRSYLSSLDFSWLQAVYNTSTKSFEVSQNVILPDTRCHYTPGTPVNKGDKVDVLWISSSEFVSSIQLHRNINDEEGEFVSFQNLYAFSLSLQVNEVCRSGSSADSLDLYVYSIQTFHEFNHSPLSEVPLHFLHHLLSPLPVGFFSDICLNMNLQDFPPGHCRRLLSIIPQDAPPLIPDNIQSETLRILTDFSVIYVHNRDQLLAFTSHQYSPHVRLCWNAFDQDQISPEEVNSALRDNCLHLRHFSISDGLSLFEDVDEPSFSSNESFRTLKIGFRQADSASCEHKLLNGLKTNRQIRQLEISFFIAEDDEEWDEQHMPVDVSSTLVLIRDVLPAHASLREMRMRVIVQDSTGDDRGHFSVVSECLQVSGVGSLSFLDVEIVSGKFGTYQCHSLSMNESWDKFISPALLLNWYLDHHPNCTRVKTPLSAQEEGEPGSGVVELVVQSINRGILYPKTTHHAPYDSRTANAGVIYDVLRKNLCR
jgi:hypothetical protein